MDSSLIALVVLTVFFESVVRLGLNRESRDCKLGNGAENWRVRLTRREVAGTDCTSVRLSNEDELGSLRLCSGNGTSDIDESFSELEGEGAFTAEPK